MDFRWHIKLNRLNVPGFKFFDNLYVRFLIF